ncbi:hypothetical protein E3N88_05165 [Mikania micrantha]|uniref:Pentacotripeptide-repeat region of PRORP domain-containing protein n=1 Tax=Mikania micrantha TaxID=192012 RepID=A0A5N6PXZ0_9ASTR|nr:hypothetical protein E3N88_05165 [Mikania micrantha]
MSLWRLFSHRIHHQPQLELHKSIIFAKSIQALAIIAENSQATSKLNITHDVEWTPGSVSYSKLLSQCCKIKSLNAGLMIHAHLIKLRLDQHSKCRNHLINLYSKCCVFGYARKLLDESPEPDLVSWSALISGYVLNDLGYEALSGFMEMHALGIRCNEFTFPSVLKACSMKKDIVGGKQIHGVVVVTGLRDINQGRKIHGYLMKHGYSSDPFSCNALVDMYSKVGDFEDAEAVFDQIINPDIVSWNALIAGCVLHEYNDMALDLLLNMRSLIDSYAKCGQVEKARKVFDESTIADLATFTSLISAYAQSGQGEEAIKVYLKLQDLELKPDSFICSSLLNTSASLSAYEQGKQIHVHTLKFGLLSDTFTANSLVNMYARCGSIDDATRAFSEVPEKGIVSWSAMIGGFAQHGHGKDALSLFDDMLKDGIAPNNVTLVSVLCACNHAGLVTQAKQYFESMESVFGIKPTQEHYACMIDILARAGKLDEAMDLVNNMPFEANASVWGALLGAARTHKNVDLGQTAAQKLMLLDPEKSGTHVLLANLYASAGLWDNVSDIRRLMKDSKLYTDGKYLLQGKELHNMI